MRLVDMQFDLDESLKGIKGHYYFTNNKHDLNIHFVLNDNRVNSIVSLNLFVQLLILIQSNISNIIDGKSTIFKSIEIIDYKRNKRIIIKDFFTDFVNDTPIYSKETKDFILIQYKRHQVYIYKKLENEKTDTSIIRELTTTNPWNIDINDYNNVRYIVITDNNLRKNCLVLI